jgi:hypothetical protein
MVDEHATTGMRLGEPRGIHLLAFGGRKPRQIIVRHPKIAQDVTHKCRLAPAVARTGHRHVLVVRRMQRLHEKEEPLRLDLRTANNKR